jgi:hypothetical protein
MIQELLRQVQEIFPDAKLTAEETGIIYIDIEDNEYAHVNRFRIWTEDNEAVVWHYNEPISKKKTIFSKVLAVLKAIKECENV